MIEASHGLRFDPKASTLLKRCVPAAKDHFQCQDRAGRALSNVVNNPHAASAKFGLHVVP
jgi:hypothetical protein